MCSSVVPYEVTTAKCSKVDVTLLQSSMSPDGGVYFSQGGRRIEAIFLSYDLANPSDDLGGLGRSKGGPQYTVLQESANVASRSQRRSCREMTISKCCTQGSLYSGIPKGAAETHQVVSHSSRSDVAKGEVYGFLLARRPMYSKNSCGGNPFSELRSCR